MGRKKRYNRKKRSFKRRHAQSTMQSQQLIVSDNFKTKIAYVDVDDPKLVITGAFSDVKTFRLNGLHDPNRKINSSSAVGHVTLSRLYNRYHITGCKVECTIMNASTACVQCLWHTQSGNKPLVFTTWGALKQFVANNDTVHKMVGFSTGDGGWSFTKYYSQKEIEGGSGFTRNALPFNCPVESDPDDQYILNGYLVALTPDGAFPAGPITLFYDLKLTYFVTYFERRDLANTTVLTDEQEAQIEIDAIQVPLIFDVEEAGGP